jgi:hypothetical protein
MFRELLDHLQTPAWLSAAGRSAERFLTEEIQRVIEYPGFLG